MSEKSFEEMEKLEQQFEQQDFQEGVQQQENQQQEVQQQQEKLDPLFKYKKYLLKQVPVPEILEAIKDFENISPIDIESTEFQEFLKEYNETNFQIAKGDNNEKFIISEIGELDNGNYQDPETQQEIEIDHFKQKIIKTTQLNLDEANVDFDKYRMAIITELKSYVSQYFDQQNTAFFVKVTGDSLADMVINIILTSKQLKVSSLWSGEWISIWQIFNNQLKGMIKINAHYFESGNIFVKQNKNHESAVQVSKTCPEADAKAIVKEIDKVEREILTEFSTIYEEMGDNLFKQMRRVLPVTKQTLDWSAVSLQMKKNLQIKK